ncbi:MULTISPECIES: Eco57I restriction-modification methylase domain-containing protein [Flavobacteriaceae]|uniref:Eco57I restriction-modification methylase domain-containing protein n=1 Tax=Flavobacteriaceae TaxID=49546 RepID=UPI000C89F9CF|nr:MULTISPECIES: N-6 DNA methylase [Flavobacteriaceae]MAM22440.1 restriction endonuclease subunit M [Croceibacter sp.]TVZ51232.1 TaqI restriction endonuclease [Dokdonia sp. Hel_I_53]WSP34656.1 N-6 DNA methylase [Croceibacter atlanticus]
MALFQTSVLKKYLAQQDTNAVDKAYRKYTKFFLNLEIQQNIDKSNEEQIQATFLTELFVNVLDYTINPKPKYNLTTEYKNEKNNRKADGAIITEEKTVAVVELKGTNTKDLESIRRQAFDYKVNHKGCRFVITSNFEKLRFYIDDTTELLDFDLFNLTRDDFGLLYLCLYKDNLLKELPLQIKQDSLIVEEQITKEFYKDYSLFKRELYRDLVKKNGKVLKVAIQEETGITDNAEHQSDLERLEKNVKLTLFKKSQKLIDRFLFIFFAEDRGLLQPNYTIKRLAEWDTIRKLDVEEPLYDRFKKHFNYLDKGRKGDAENKEIFAYNGGLFKPDSILDRVIIDDDLLYHHTKKLATYDFESQVDVNILGHIFENSLNEIESINAEIEGGNFDKQKSKRKKDGVFYTPKYITKYIVENTVGKLCDEKKAVLGFKEEEYFKGRGTGRKKRNDKTIQKLVETLDTYRNWLLQITICDPACGSGAFLNQALDFLIKEHQYIDELKTKILGGGLQFPDIENTILENNIYGVDLNEESVEIAKLSLWLRTAQPRRKLNDLSSNIKCGNSLIDSKTIAGDKAFNWETAFAKVFANGGFDVVIGNPPWGAKLPTNDLKYVKSKHQDIIVRMVDSFMFFMDKSIDLTNDIGVIGMIIPDVILYQKDNSKLREKILKETQLQIALNVGDGIFEEVARPSAIVVYSKKKSKNPSIVGNFNKYKDVDINSIDTYEVESELFYSIPNTVFATQNLSGYEILKRHNTKTLNDFIDTDGIQRGVSPDLKDAFIVDADTIKTENLEEQYIRPTVTGGVDVKRYYTIDADKNLFYITKNDNPQDFPNIHDYIEKYLPRITCKEVAQGKHPFYALHRARNPQIFEKENKVLGVITGDSIITSIDKNELFPTDGLYVFSANDKISNKYLSAILNSRLSTYLYRLLSSETGRTMAQVKPVLLSQLPFIEPDKTTVQKIESLYDLISKEIKSFTTIQDKFLKYLYHQFRIEKFSRKLENWQDLDFGEFIKELNKAIKANNKLREKEGQAPVAVLTKTDEFEWLDLFEQNKKKAQDLQLQINTLEQQIDTMVYELYGLSDEEIRIVENG